MSTFHHCVVLEQDACDKTDAELYPKYKEWCDEYFDNTHRGEKRGIGGIFFDDVDGDYEKWFKFIQDCGVRSATYTLHCPYH